MSDSSYSQVAILDSMESVGLIPVFYHDNPTVAGEVLEAAYNGGVRAFEFTNRGKKALDVFLHLRELSREFKDLALGIGTIMNAASAQTFIEAGANFIVSPIFKKEIADYCEGAGRLWIPGCATLTEIVNAMDAGAKLVKVFPGSVLGPNFISSVLPVIPGAKLMPTGGVEPTSENLSQWFRAGVTCVGMGSQLFSKELIQSPHELQSRVEQTINIIRTIRDSK